MTTPSEDHSTRETPMQGPPRGGLVHLYKPRGYSSFRMVSRLRKLMGIRKIGHAGTLDPFAEGVLPLLVGRSTRLAQYLEGETKHYRLVLIPGADTTTQDLTGDPVRIEPVTPEQLAAWQADDGAAVRRALDALTGTFRQAVPRYSAVKVDGRPLYDYARRGEIPPKRPVREITVHEARLVDMVVAADPVRGLTDDELGRLAQHFEDDAPDGDRGQPGDMDIRPHPDLPPAPAAFVIDWTVSKGTYIRTLAQTLGERWGTGAYAYRLQRRAVGHLWGRTAVLPETLEAAETGADTADREAKIRRWDAHFRRGDLPGVRDPRDAVASLPVLELGTCQSLKMMQGQRITLPRERWPGTAGDGPATAPALAAAQCDGLFIGVIRLTIETDGSVLCTTERMITTREDLPR